VPAADTGSSGDTVTSVGAGPAGSKRATLRPALVATAVATVLACAYLAAPLMGGDLSAQLAHADFARSHPLTPVDLRWFGGTLPFGYSLWVPALMALLGGRVVGAVSAVAATFIAVNLFQRVGARRPTLGGIAAAICQASNLAEGRVAFAAGMACGLGALLAVTGTTAKRRTITAIWAILAGAANPVAALLLWLCAAVAVLRRRFGDAAVLLVSSALPVAIISGAFADGGRQVFNPVDALRAALVSVLVAVVVPGRYRAVRLGAGLGVVMVVSAYVLPTPVGGNAMRLTLLFAVPLVAALVECRPALTALTIAVAVLVQTPVTFGTVTGAGAPATHASYYSGLIRAIHAQGPVTGRLEIPELTGHWEAAYAARKVPLARGWLRQVDTELNDDVFYRHLPTPATYRSFLDDNAVEYVAVPDARLTFYGRREAALIRTELPYLSDVWHDRHWTLYAVDNPVPIVESPGALIGYTADKITFTAPYGSTVKINIRWFAWLTVNGDRSETCIGSRGRSVVVTAGNADPGFRYVVTSRLRPGYFLSHC
jgi:hypothetical protein